jgi:hypothetical protein
VTGTRTGINYKATHGELDEIGQERPGSHSSNGRNYGDVEQQQEDGSEHTVGRTRHWTWQSMSPQMKTD